MSCVFKSPPAEHNPHKRFAFLSNSLIDCVDLKTPVFNRVGGIGISDFNGPKGTGALDFKSLKTKKEGIKL